MWIPDKLFKLRELHICYQGCCYDDDSNEWQSFCVSCGKSYSKGLTYTDTCKSQNCPLKAGKH